MLLTTPITTITSLEYNKEHMKLEILQENLNAVLNQLNRIIPSKPQLPILSSILVEAKENQITLFATDLYLGIKTSVPGKVIKPGKIAIPGKMFFNIIKSLGVGKLKLDFAESTLTIISDDNRTTLACLDESDFPEFPEVDGTVHTLKSTSITEIQSMVSFSTSSDPTRPVLTAILFQFSQAGLLAVGTDGFRLATLSLKTEKMTEESSFLIPAKAIAEISKISSSQEVTEISLQISEQLKQIVLSIGQTQFFVRLIEGDYPPYQKIIPSDFILEAEIDGQEFESQLKRAQVFAKESSNIIRLKFSQAGLMISAVSSAYGTQEGKMMAEIIRGESGEIAFNSKYLLDFMSALKPEKISFLMNESLTPAMMRPTNKKEFQYIVMPFRVNE